MRSAIQGPQRTGTCSGCGERRHVRLDGLVRLHRVDGAEQMCPGSHHVPDEGGVRPSATPDVTILLGAVRHVGHDARFIGTHIERALLENA